MARTYPVILFGETKFGAEDFITASLIEEFSPLSITLPINQLKFSMYSSNTDFSVINPTGAFESLATKQPMALYLIVDGQQRYYGQYYLDKWENESEQIKEFTCYNIIGILDEYDDYLGGLWLTPVTVGELVSSVLDPVDIDFEIDPDTAAVELTGWLPISTRREALQQIAFAAGAYILSARRDSIVIGKLTQAAIEKSGLRAGVGKTGQSRVWQTRFRGSQSFVYTGGGVVTRGYRSGVPKAGQSRIWGKRWRASQWEGVKPIVDIPTTEQGARRVTLRPQVTGIEVTAHDIVSGTGRLEILNQSLAAGSHLIKFQQPVHDLKVTGATITESGANYAILNVAASGAVTLVGAVYIVTDRIFNKYLPAVAGRKENIIKVTDATLVNSNNGETVLQALYDYYQQRYEQNMKLFAPSQYSEPGATVDIETLYSNRLFGVIEKMTTNLTGGVIAETQVIGIIK